MKCSVLHSKGSSEGNVDPLICPLLTLMYGRDGYLGRGATAKSERYLGCRKAPVVSSKKQNFLPRKTNIDTIFNT